MMRIVWDGYIQDQMHWAERLSKIAEESDNGTAAVFKDYADRAFANAGTAMARVVAIGAAMRGKPQATSH